MPEQSRVVYFQVAPVAPEAHLYEVCCRIPVKAGERLQFSLPAWIPGSYMIRNFARHIISMEAFAAGKPLRLRKLDKQTWQAERAPGPLSLRYRVYAWELSVRAAYLDASRAYFNGPCLFVLPRGWERAAFEIDLLPPKGMAYQSWRVATTWEALEVDERGFGRYRARDYADLIDHPVEMSDFSRATFGACGVAHDIVISGRHDTDMARLSRDLEKLCRYHIEFFADRAPMSRYLFQVMAVGEGYGGLEHRDSTSLICRRDHLPRQGMNDVDEGYREFLALCSHEYFHCWNVKRICPERFIAPDLSREVHTELLWWFEGVTSYYDELALVRCKLISAADYLDMLAQTLTRVLRGQGRFLQSVAESSFDAWTKFYLQDENAPNAIVSYYTKGAMIALVLDLTIRLQSRGAHSLDSVMRYLWRHYGRQGRGVPEHGMGAIISEATGLRLDELLQQAVYSTEDLPVAELLAQFGVEMRLRPSYGADDKGGRHSGLPPRCTLGIRAKAHPCGIELSHVFSSSPAERAGLAAGDIIVALDELKADMQKLEAWLGRRQPGERVKAHAFRRDELLVCDLELDAAPVDSCELHLMACPGDEVLQRRQAWLEA